MKPNRFAIFLRDGFTCRYCGAQAPDVALHVDHVIPKADGGTDDPVNLATACTGCNLGKGRTDIADTVHAARIFIDNHLAERRRQQTAELTDALRVRLDAWAAP